MSAPVVRTCFHALTFIINNNTIQTCRSNTSGHLNPICRRSFSSYIGKSRILSIAPVRKLSSSSSSATSNNSSNNNSSNSSNKNTSSNSNSNSGDIDRKKHSSTSRKLGSSNNRQSGSTSSLPFWSREKQKDNDKDKDSSAGVSSSEKLFICSDPPVYSADAERLYRDDTAQSSRWRSTAVFKNYGRVYDADKELLQDGQTKAFPAVKCLSLTGKDAIYPDNIDADVKLVGLSFKQYGQDACKSWLYPFSQNFKSEYDRVKVGELLINEFQILSGLQFMFVSGAKSTVPEDRWSTSAVKVGGVTVSEWLAINCSTVVIKHMFLIFWRYFMQFL
jgi:hypothetical protein